MQFVFVVGNYKNGGVPMRSTNLANAFARNGHNSTILVTGDIADNVFFSLEDGVRLLSLKEYNKEHRVDPKVLKHKAKALRKIKLLKNIRFLTRFLKSLDKKIEAKIRDLRKGDDLSAFVLNNKDCIYICFGVSYYEKTFCAGKDLGCRIIYAERNAPEMDFPKEINAKNRLINMVAKADGVILQTEDELKFFEGKIKKSRVIHNPVKSGLPLPFTETRRKVIVNFCRVAEQKNLPFLIDAFKEFHDEYSEYLLEIYGNTVVSHEEALLDELKQYVKDIDADDYIKFLPPRSDIHEVVKDAMMFVSSSDFEGLSNSMVEALAIGLPCVCTDCLGGGAREMIKNGENGLLVPMNDKTALANAMKKIAADEGLREKCSKNAAKVREDLSLEKISDNWLEFIESVI